MYFIQLHRENKYVHRLVIQQGDDPINNLSLVFQMKQALSIKNDLHPNLNLLKISALCLNPGLRQEINQFRYNSTYSDGSGQISRQTEAWLPKRSR